MLAGKERAAQLEQAQAWFAEHVTLGGQPYTLDADQARAAVDDHKNTLVTARAGSGKTRVIVAKVAYLVAQRHVSLSEIAIFMFNRTAAAEVNQRIKAVKVDGKSLVRPDSQVRVASTFHKYALDLAKATGERPQIIDSVEHDRLIREALNRALAAMRRKVNPSEKRELLSIVSGFVARAGQRFLGSDGFAELTAIVQDYCETATNSQFRFYHELSYRVYTDYLEHIRPPQTDFNLQMARASELLDHAADSSSSTPSFDHVRRLKHLMIDEYQDFSFLFFALTAAIRRLAPNAKLFAVGDDWQAINRFAGSDVDYFLNFQTFFSEDSINIPLATNYRSARKIVEHANHYMLKHYDPHALPAKAFNSRPGKIKRRNPQKQRFDATDIAADALDDGRFQVALARAANLPPAKVSPGAAQLLKQIFKIIKHHRRSEIMLLHRHNFTTFDGISLETLHAALGDLLAHERIMSAANFAERVRSMTMHKSKGLESEVVILLEVDCEVVTSCHPHATIFSLFGDTRAAESADQKRLLYVAMTRAKKRLYILSSDRHPPI